MNSSPFCPLTPVGPTAPVAPVPPNTPAWPGSPLLPVGPVPPNTPFIPSAPVAPAAPTSPFWPFKPDVPAGPVGPLPAFTQVNVPSPFVFNNCPLEPRTDGKVNVLAPVFNVTSPANFIVLFVKSPSINGSVVFVFAINNLFVAPLYVALFPASLPINTLPLPVFDLPAL